MIDMAEAKETKEETKKDEVTGDTLVWSEAERKYVNKTMSPELYKQQKKAQTRQAAIAGATGLAAEGLQFAIGQSVFNDPSVRAAQADKARLAAQIKKGPDYLSDAEKSERRQAALAPVERRAEALQRRSEAIAASTGDVSVRSLLASGEAGIAQMRQQALETEAGIAKEDLTRQQLKEQQDEKARQDIAGVDAMMLELRNKYIREPLHKFIADAGKVTGTLMAYAPAKTIDSQIERLTALKVPPEKIAEFSKLAGRNPRAARKMFRELIGKRKSEDTGETTTEDVAAEVVEPEINFLPADKYWAGKEPEDGTDFRTWARKNYPGVMEGTKKSRLDPEGPLNSQAFKNAWNEYGEEYLRATTEPVSVLTPEQIKEQALAASAEAKAEAAENKTQETSTSVEQNDTDDDLSSGPAVGEQARVKELYKVQKTVAPHRYDILFKKQTDDKYAYGFKDGVWTVYRGDYPTQPYISPNTGEGVSFTLEEAKNHGLNNVKELYSLAIAEGLVK